MRTTTLSHPDRRQGERRHLAQHAQGSERHGGKTDGHSMPMARYGRFWAMVTTSTAIGWAAMYLNTYQLDHVMFSWMRVFMAMIMGGVMTAVMMAFMWRMYPNRRANFGVLGVGAALFIAGLALARTQATIDDVAWMRAMVPHHSIAILTSERANLQDPRTQELARNIIETQKREIAQMKQLIDRMEP